MTRSDYERVKTRVHASWNGDLILPKLDVMEEGRHCEPK
jgi:hypothetical protein